MRIEVSVSLQMNPPNTFVNDLTHLNFLASSGNTVIGFHLMLRISLEALSILILHSLEWQVAASKRLIPNCESAEISKSLTSSSYIDPPFRLNSVATQIAPETSNQTVFGPGYHVVTNWLP